MALTLVGTAVSIAGNGTETSVVAEVASGQTGDVGYVFIATKPAESGDQPLPVVDTVTLETTTWEAIGWTQVADEVVGSGSHGASSGPVRLQVYKRVATSNDEFTHPTENFLIPVVRTGTNGGLAIRIQVWRPGSGEVISEAFTTGSDTAADTTWSVTGDSSPGFETDDQVVLWTGITNSSTQAGGISSLSASGATFTSPTDATTATQVRGSVRGSAAIAEVDSGSSTANPIYTAQSNGSAGGTLFLRLRAVPEPDEISLSVIPGQGSLFALSGREEGTLAAASGDGTVNALTGALNATLGLIEETGTLFPVGQLYALDHISGSAEVFDLTQTLHGPLGLVTETGTLFSVTGHMEGTLGVASGAATFRDPLRRMQATLGNISETHTANAINGAAGYTLGLVTGDGTLFVPKGVLSGTLGTASGIDTANALTYGELYGLDSIAGSAALNDLAGALSGTLGQATEVGTLWPVTGRLEGALGEIAETGTLFTLHGSGAGTLGLVTETGDLFPIRGAQPVVVLGLIEETGDVLALSGETVGTLGLITSAGQVFPLTLEFPFAIQLEQPVIKVVVNPRAVRLHIP